MDGHGFKSWLGSFLSILWVFKFHNFISKMSQESQVHLNFADYDKLSLGLSAISISPQSEERQFWPVGCPWAGCKIGWHQNLLTSPHFQKSDSVSEIQNIAMGCFKMPHLQRPR